ncbi:MAG TPA: hypothetical protein VGF28_04110 [Thermoanaerobaculia bacterium]|jgi:hypothetical protein
MYNPDEDLIRLLSENDTNLREHVECLKSLEEKYYAPSTPEDERKKLVKQMRSLRERVDERISIARSA